MEMRLTPVLHAIDNANPAEEERLRLSAGMRVLRLERLRYAGGKVRTYEQSVLPLHRLPGIRAERLQHSTLTEIAKEFGLELGKATEHLSFSHPPPAIARRLTVGLSQQLLLIDRVVTTIDEVPIEWCVVYAMEMAS
jgi:DNA-binding GntR family transcriptional regulator